jgi:carbon starvation protein CstA
MSAFNADSPSVHKYLDLLQGVINRMAANCPGCKTWCITLVSATVVIIADKSKPEYVWIAFVPLVLFCFLDAYYLALERSFRNRYNAFVDQLHATSVTVNDLYTLTPQVDWSSRFKSFGSSSIYPFYLFLALMLLAIRFWIIPSA